MNMKKLIVLLSVLSSAFALSAKEVELYEYASEVKTSRLYSVTADGKKVTVVQTAEPDIAVFGADGEVTVKVTFTKPAPDSVAVRPFAKEYNYTFKKNTLTLKLKPGDRVSVEPNYSWQKPLFIFVNLLEADAVEAAKNDPATVFYEAGKVHHIGQLPLGKTKNLYIQGGAVVEGFVDVRNREGGLTMAGCGILDGRPADGVTFRKTNPVRIQNCPDVKMNDLIVLNEDYWTTYFINCDRTRIENLHVVATFSNLANGFGCENDGLDICASQDVTVKGCFIYCHDDAYCVKSSSKWWPSRLAKDITFEDCIAWNVDSGNSFEIGHMLGGGVENVKYKDIYAIHSGRRGKTTFHRAGISIHPSPGPFVKNISYENVWIEDPLEHAVCFEVFTSPYKHLQSDWYAGYIENVTVKNLHVYKKSPLGNVVQGYDADSKVRNVRFIDFYLEGKKVNSLEDGDFRKTDFSDNIKFE